MQPVQIPATFDGMSTRKDRSVSMRFSSAKELTPEEVMNLMQYHLDNGWLLFAPNELQAADIPRGAATDERKSPSERYRSKLYVLFVKTGGMDTHGIFDNFYRRHLDALSAALDRKIEAAEASAPF